MTEPTNKVSDNKGPPSVASPPPPVDGGGQGKVDASKLKKVARVARRVWHVAEYELEAGRAVPLPDAQQFFGLIVHHFLDGEIGAPPRHVSYWESREAFEENRAPLEKALGSGKLRRSTWARKLQVPRESWWKRIPVYGALLHVVAALGALTALEKHYDWLFEKPRVTMNISASDPINLLEGEHLETDLVISNNSSRVTADVSKVVSTLSRGGSKLPIIDGGVYVVGEGKELRVPIRVPNPARGTHQLEMRGRTRSGRTRGALALAAKRTVKVWDRGVRVEKQLGSGLAWRATVDASLWLGEAAPSGLDCQATLTGELGVRFGPLRFPEVPSWPNPKVSSNGSVSSQSWSTPPLGRFSEIKFSLFLEGTPTLDWKRTLERLELGCQVVNVRKP